jgi:hypothetical protein
VVADFASGPGLRVLRVPAWIATPRVTARSVCLYLAATRRESFVAPVSRRHPTPARIVLLSDGNKTKPKAMAARK